MASRRITKDAVNTPDNLASEKDRDHRGIQVRGEDYQWSFVERVGLHNNDHNHINAQSFYDLKIKDLLDTKHTFTAYVESYQLSPSSTIQNCTFRLGISLIGPKETTILSQLTYQLNDECINAFTAIFQSVFLRKPETRAFATECAVFTSFDLGVAVNKRLEDSQVWRMTKHTKFWEKRVWIVPIYRPRQLHWVLAIIVIAKNHHEIRLYDSLALEQWRDDLEVFKIYSFGLAVCADQISIRMFGPLLPGCTSCRVNMAIGPRPSRPTRPFVSNAYLYDSFINRLLCLR